MKLPARRGLLIATLSATMLVSAGCNQRSPSATATPPPATTAGQAVNTVAVAADDTTITTKIKTALLAEPGLKSLDISVDTKNGTVTLSGKVDSADQRDRAKQLALTTGGVKNVVDNLSVKS